MKKLSVTQYSDIKIYNRLKSWYLSASKEQILLGLDWYKDAQNFCKTTALKYNLDNYIVASVVSALSPNNKWERNKVDAITVIEAFLAGLGPDDVKVCTYNSNKLKAFAILREGTKISAKSPKTHSFAMNVGLLSSEHITIDKWHLRACLLYPKDGIKTTVESCTAVQYRRIETITAKLAKEYNIKGYELQAIIWLTIKNAWNR